MSTAELVALELKLEFERSMRNREDATALRLIARLKQANARAQKSDQETAGAR